MDIIKNKERFIEVANKFITRDGIDKLMAWVNRTDFFVCPASTAYNLPVEGGLCQHSLNVLDALTTRYYGKVVEEFTQEDIDKRFENDMTIESIVLVALFSSIHKANCYVKDFKNVKVNGKWEQQEYWRWDEQFIYNGRGPKSVYILQQYIRLYIEEAQAISFYLAGEDNLFANITDTTYRKIYESSKLATCLHLAEMESTYILDKISLES